MKEKIPSLFSLGIKAIENKAKPAAGKILIGLIYFIGFPLLLLFLGGDIHWGQAWAYLAVSYFASFLSRVLMAMKHPDLIMERSSYADKPDTKPWDRILSPLVALWLPLAYFIVAGLDKRFGWSEPLPIWTNIIAWIVTIIGFAVANWAIVENRFFSAVVRIQTDRGHTVVESGPYRFVRHPGYSGSLLVGLMFPLILGTSRAYIPIALFAAVVVIRTAKEDKTLIDELPGYLEYTQKTRYRLLPLIF